MIWWANTFQFFLFAVFTYEESVIKYDVHQLNKVSKNVLF